MRGNQGALAGASDPSKEGWRDRVNAVVAASASEKIKRRGLREGYRNVAIGLTPGYAAFLDRAAQGRGISRLSYIRRAVARQVARDLGVPWVEVLAVSQPPVPWGENNRVDQGRRQDDGEGFGDWSN
jgi:hypothetical protein